MALTIYGEARGETWDSKRATAHVIRNRLLSHRYPDSFVGVCLTPHAFSCWSNKPTEAILRDQHAMLMAIAFPDQAWLECLAVATLAMSGRDEDLTGGATLYHATNMDPKPTWASSSEVTEVGAIGHQTYYKEKR